MYRNGFHCVRTCIALTSAMLCFVQATSATASRTHILKPGETLSQVARKYGVMVEDIAKANQLPSIHDLPEKRPLLIPEPPRPVIASPTMHTPATINGDRITVRIGPGISHRRIEFFDKGAPMTATARRDGWVQVILPDGRSGWVREDFLDIGVRGKRQVAAHRPAATENETKSRAGKPQKRSASAHQSEKRSEKRPTTARAEHRRPKPASRTAAKPKRPGTRSATRPVLDRHLARKVIEETDTPKDGNDIVRTAYAYRGTPYRYGGSSRGGFDCSGFTSYLYRKKGVALPHTATGQFHLGKKVNRGELKPGDLVFFQTGGKPISHVGIYVGDGRFIHSSNKRSGGVREDSLDSAYYRGRYRGARRVRE